MKKLILTAIMISGSMAFAKGGPCKEVREACRAAGKKGMEVKSCVKTIKGGGTVEGVSVEASDACKAKR